MNARNSFMLFNDVVVVASDVGTMEQTMYSFFDSDKAPELRSRARSDEYPIEQDPLNFSTTETYAHVSSAAFEIR